MMLQYSTFESDFFKLRIARGECVELNEHSEMQLMEEARNQSLDVVRIKIDLSVPNQYQFFSRLSAPLYFSGGITEYIHTGKSPGMQEKLKFIRARPEDEELFKTFFYETFNEHDIGYHHTPHLNAFITQQQELDCLFQFYRQFIYKENHQIVFLQKEEKLVGFSTIEVTDDNTLLLPITGILPQFRSGGLYHELIESYLWYFDQHPFARCIFSSRLDNYTARHIYSKFGFRHHGTKYNYVLTPFFHQSENEFSFESTNADISALDAQIRSTYGDLRLKSFKRFCFEEKGKGDAVHVHCVYKRAEQALFVGKLMNGKNIHEIIWMEYAAAR